VPGSLWEFADLLQQLFPADLSRLLHALAFGQLRDRRSARHRRHASLRPKPYVDDPISLQLHTQLQNVAARWVFQPRSGICSLHDAGVTRILEMVQQLGRIHTPIVNVPALDDPSRTTSPTI
jgi:hypothetical protein